MALTLLSKEQSVSIPSERAVLFHVKISHEVKIPSGDWWHASVTDHMKITKGMVMIKRVVAIKPYTDAPQLVRRLCPNKPI